MHSEEEKKVVGKHARQVSEPEKTQKGVPFAVTALLVVLALACGCVSGYFVGANMSNTAKQLEEAQQRIEDYELLLAGMYTDEIESGEQAEAAQAVQNLEEEGAAALAGQNVVEPEDTEEKVVVEYNGGVILNTEAQATLDKVLADLAFAGEDVNADNIVGDMLADMASEKIAYAKAAELGFTEYDEKDRRDIDALAQSEYDSTVSFYTGGATDEETVRAAQEFLSGENGYTLESVRAEIEAGYWKEKLYGHVTADVTVGAEDISTLYAQRVEAQKAEFEADPTAYESALMSGDIVVYNPEGYRTVKQIFFAFSAEESQRVSEINAQLATETDDAVIAQLNAEKEALYAPLEAEAEQAIEEFNAGADFDDLIGKYGDAGALSADAFSSTGYYISDDTVIWPKSFVVAGMSLMTPGDISEPVRSEQGVHIARFIANVEPGSVPLSNVSSRLTTATQDAKKQETWDQQLTAWLEEAGVVYYPENIE